MKGLSEHELLLSILAIALILVLGRGSAEIARRFKQAEVLGELLGGFLIGPSVLGALLPGVYHALFLNPNVGLALSMLSWIGAILILLIAGLEVDLKIVRQLAKPGGLTAFFAISTSVVVGTVFSRRALGSSGLTAFFFGVVLSVTGVSVIAKILIERDALRRGYAQVILAAGVASEIVVWPVISVVASFRDGNPWMVGARSAGFVLLFFLLLMTIGRRFTFWAMRRTADLTQVVSGQLSLVLVLAFVSAAITLAMGLHPLLGAFVFGVVLGQAPRTTAALKESVQALAVGLFAPVFFVLAGMRVDIFRLRSGSAILLLLLLLVVATVCKSSMAALGARLGGMRGWEPALIGVGVNLKGGTDVIVAILGVELGLLSTETYTMYAVVAILTVLFSPSLVGFLERRVAPSQEEMLRLNREEAKRRAYFPKIERVLVPMTPELLPSVSAGLVQTIAVAKQAEDEIFDITELLPANDPVHPAPEPDVTQAIEVLDEASALEKVELTTGVMTASDPGEAILEAAKKHNIVVIAVGAPERRAELSFGEMQDRIIQNAQADVLVVVREPRVAEIRRILVPINGHEHSMAAADIAAYVGKASGAEIVLFSVMHPRFDSMFWREREHRRLLASGYRLLREVKFRTDRLEVQTSERVQLGTDVTQEILKELGRQPYDLVVLGTVDRGTDEELQLGRSVHPLLAQSDVPVVVLVTHLTTP